MTVHSSLLHYQQKLIEPLNFIVFLHSFTSKKKTTGKIHVSTTLNRTPLFQGGHDEPPAKPPKAYHIMLQEMHFCFFDTQHFYTVYLKKNGCCTTTF